MSTRRSTFGIALLLGIALSFGGVSDAFAQQQESKLAKVTKAKELRAGWAAYKPFAYRDNEGKLTGFAIEYIEEMGKALNVKVTWVEDSWATLVAGLVADKFEITVNANRTPARLMVAEFSEPMAVTKKGFLIRKADQDKLRNPEDLRNPKVRVAFTLGDAASEAMGRLYPEPQKISFPNFADLLLGLVTGKTDALAADFSILLQAAADNSNLMVPPDSAWFANDMGLYVKQGDQIWLNWINWFVRDTKADGRVAALIKKYNIVGMDVAK